MPDQQQSWPAARIVHLSGGCRAINNNDPGPIVVLFPIATIGKQVQLTLPSYGAIYPSLQSLGLFIVGVEFYSHVLEAKGKVPPNWRPYHRCATTAWPWDEPDMKWSHIGHNAHKRKNGRLWDLASRISHQMRVCSWRLRQISEAYREQLFAKYDSSGFPQGQRFEDGFTWLAFLSIQSFLVDACILRDYLAEFSAHFIYASHLKSATAALTSMSGLKKNILDKIADADAVTQLLKAATSEGGWLKELGEYRDMVVHSAPLARAEQKLYAVCEVLDIGEHREPAPVRQVPDPGQPTEHLKNQGYRRSVRRLYASIRSFHQSYCR